MLHPEQGIENKTISRFHEKIDVGSTGIVDNKPIQALFPFARMFTDTRNAMYTLAFALFLAFISFVRHGLLCLGHLLTISCTGIFEPQIILCWKEAITTIPNSHRLPTQNIVPSRSLCETNQKSQHLSCCPTKIRLRSFFKLVVQDDIFKKHRNVKATIDVSMNRR